MRPGRTAGTPRGAPRRIEGAGGVGLRLWSLPGPEGAARILVLPGFWRSGQSPRMRRLAVGLGDRYRPSILDHRGHGRSGGIFRFGAREVEDLALVLDRLQSEDSSPIGMIGFSMGGNFALCALGSHPGRFPAVASVAVVSAPRDPGRLRPRWWRPTICRGIRLSEVWRVPRAIPPALAGARPDPAALAGSISPVPLLVIHAEGDWLVPETDAREIFDAARPPKEYRVLPNRRHCHADALMLYAPGDLRHLVDAWFDATLLAVAGAAGAR